MKSKLAIDFFLEDLKSTNTRIRCRAKEFACENELNYWRDRVIDFVMEQRSKL